MTRERLRDLPNEPWAQWVRFIAQVIVIPIVFWAVSAEIRIQTTDGNRWTSGDEAKAQLEHERQHTALLMELSNKANKTEILQRDEILRELEHLRDEVKAVQALANRIHMQLENGR